MNALEAWAFGFRCTETSDELRAKTKAREFLYAGREDEAREVASDYLADEARAHINASNEALDLLRGIDRFAAKALRTEYKLEDLK